MGFDQDQDNSVPDWNIHNGLHKYPSDDDFDQWSPCRSNSVFCLSPRVHIVRLWLPPFSIGLVINEFEISKPM